MAVGAATRPLCFLSWGWYCSSQYPAAKTHRQPVGNVRSYKVLYSTSNSLQVDRPAIKANYRNIEHEFIYKGKHRYQTKCNTSEK